MTKESVFKAWLEQGGALTEAGRNSRAYGTDEASIPDAQADRIAMVARASAFSGRSGEGVLEHGCKGLRARGVVGVIATSDCQLEILPKIEGTGEVSVTDATLRHRLIHMLAVVHDLPIDAGAMTQLGWQRDTVLELLIRLFCAKLADAVRKGMPRHYIAHEADLPAMRGRLDVTRQFSTLAVSPRSSPAGSTRFPLI
jgi:5-methylcytosine-specific restriction enzyme subunit McrC